jgi:RsiW-degrading membrane proteinase PrsW (M82 family)
MFLILAIASLFAAVIPMITYLIIIWWLDRNEREPFWILLLNFFWGATGAIVLGIIGSLIFQIPVSVIIQTVSDGDVSKLIDLSGAIITAPIVEEFTKGIFLIIMSMQKEFDGLVDGVVYGGAIGLGFGMTENFMYFLTYGSTPVDWFTLVIIRTVFSAVMHCMSQATFGAFIGLAKFKSSFLKLILWPAGFLCAVFLHFTWNLTVSLENTSLLGMMFLVIYFFALFAIFQISLYLESRTIMKELKDESALGMIPSEHLNYIPYVSKRFKYGWCPIGVNQKNYVQSAIKLGLRKYQYKNSKGKMKLIYERDVELLRYNIQMMFYNAAVQYNNRSGSI